MRWGGGNYKKKHGTNKPYIVKLNDYRNDDYPEIKISLIPLISALLLYIFKLEE